MKKKWFILMPAVIVLLLFVILARHRIHTAEEITGTADITAAPAPTIVHSSDTEEDISDISSIPTEEDDTAVQFSEESIREFVDNRHRGEALERYAPVVEEAVFDEGCEELEENRYDVALQFKGFLDNMFGEDADMANMLFTRKENKYYASASVNGTRVTYRVQRYGGRTYDFEMSPETE